MPKAPQYISSNTAMGECPATATKAPKRPSETGERRDRQQGVVE